MKRIHFRHRQFKKPLILDIYPVNERIRFPELRVIDENGQMIGVLPTSQALALAKEKNLDLVAVSPKANPPVAKILDYGSFKYQQEKAAKKQKALQKAVEIKEIRVSPRISPHDLEIRLKQAEKFIKRGDKISILVFLKGRERQHPEIARELIVSFIKSLGQIIEIKLEQEVKRQGNAFSAIIVSQSQKLD